MSVGVDLSSVDHIEKTGAFLHTMKLARHSRVVATIIALMSILFAQLAVAAYVCPSTQVAQAIASAQENHAATGLSHSPDCEEPDMASPVLCHAHGQVGTQSLDKPPVPNIAPFVPVKLLVAMIRDDGWSRIDSYTIDPSTLRRTTAPPLSIRNCCFRI